MEKLTPAQEKALGFIHGAIEERGSAPTLRELCSLMGYKAVGSAQDVIAALRKKGYLAAPAKQAARAFMLTDKARQITGATHDIHDDENYFMVPCLGAVPAGNPLEAIEERVETMRISRSMLQRPRPRADKLFALKADGESMIGAGIMDGDWLVVASQKEAGEWCHRDCSNGKCCYMQTPRS